MSSVVISLGLPKTSDRAVLANQLGPKSRGTALGAIFFSNRDFVPANIGD
jgi:hypothetical protein